jgi:hypothetical protein
MINKNYLVDLLASKFLASAIYSQFSSVSILEARADTYGFSCCFKSKQNIHEDLFPFLEQTIKQLTESSEIRCQEMVRDVAINFLKHKGFKKKAEECCELHQNQLLSVLEIGGYVDAFEEEISLEELLPQLKYFKILDLSTGDSLDGSPSCYYTIKGICAKEASCLKKQVKQIKEAKAKFHVNALLKCSFLAKCAERFVELSRGVAYKKELCKQVISVFETHRYTEVTFFDEPDEAFLEKLVLSKPYSQNLKLYFFETCSTFIDSLEKDLGLYSLEKNLSAVFLENIDNSTYLNSVKQIISLIDSLFRNWQLPYSLFFNCYVEKEKKQINSQAVFQKILTELELDNKVEESREKQILKGQECQLVFAAEDAFGRAWDLFTIEIKGKKHPIYLESKLVSVERLIAILQDINKIFS